jgi:hypothetical protein
MGIWEEGRKLRHLRVVQPIAGSWRFRRRAGGKAANATTAIVRTVYACLTYDPGSPFFLPRIQSNCCEASTARQCMLACTRGGQKIPFHNKLTDLGVQLVDVNGTYPIGR